MALDLDVKQRLGLVNKVIDVHESGQRYRAGKERAEFMERELNRLKEQARNQDEAMYLEKVISPDIPLDQETHPDFFPQRQRGQYPSTLRGIKRGYEDALGQQKVEVKA